MSCFSDFQHGLCWVEKCTSSHWSSLDYQGLTPKVKLGLSRLSLHTLLTDTWPCTKKAQHHPRKPSRIKHTSIHKNFYSSCCKKLHGYQVWHASLVTLLLRVDRWTDFKLKSNRGNTRNVNAANRNTMLDWICSAKMSGNLGTKKLAEKEFTNFLLRTSQDIYTAMFTNKEEFLL